MEYFFDIEFVKTNKKSKVGNILKGLDSKKCKYMSQKNGENECLLSLRVKW